MADNDVSIQISDDSGDRRYFTIVPNYILNHSTANAQALYMQLKRLAGESGVAYPGRDYLMKRLHISHVTLSKEFKYLLDHGWIENVGVVNVQTSGGPQKLKAYKMVDLWKLNAEHFKGGKDATTPLAKGGKDRTTRGVKTEPQKKSPAPEEKQKPLLTSSPVGFDLKETLRRWDAGGVRRFEVLSWFIRERGLVPSSKERLDDIVSRYVRTAKKLEKYTDRELVLAQKAAAKFDEWTLDTVFKYLTK